MKEIYKDKVTNNIESCITKTKVVREMVTGEKADSKTQVLIYNKSLKYLRKSRRL